jgi:hypothetical protein
MTTLAYLHRLVLPAAYALLPRRMESPAATAMLLSIALQESKCVSRRQVGGGPARGFWQFEKGGGVAGVITHHTSRPIIGPILGALSYGVSVDAAYAALEHNDVLAACFARCLLWTLPHELPFADDPADGWGQYVEAWRPGKPHPETWAEYYRLAWSLAGATHERRTVGLN